MRPPLCKCFILLAFIAAATVSINARTFPLEKITRGAQEFFGTVSYDVEKAYAGNHNLELTVSLSTKETTNLELLKFDPPDPAKIRFTQISSIASMDPATRLQTSEYKYLVDIQRYGAQDLSGNRLVRLPKREDY